jgi:hypothetical protein
MASSGVHDAVPEGQIAISRVFEVEVAVVPAVAKGLGDQGVQLHCLDPEQVQIVLFRVNHTEP